MSHEWNCRCVDCTADWDRMTLDTDVTPDPKSRSLTRGRRKYRRIVASPKRWQAIMDEKIGPCRVCGSQANNGVLHGKIQLHHIVSREDHGDDVPENIVPLCPVDHTYVTQRDPGACLVLMLSLEDAEYAYMIARGGENYAERAYGLVYARPSVSGGG